MSISKTLVLVCALITLLLQETSGALHAETRKLINRVNENGPYLGLVVPNQYEMDPLLESSSFVSKNLTIDFSGRRFRFGAIDKKEVIVVMTGLSVVAGNANPSFNIGDVVIPQNWSHSALWNWQRYGQGPEDELALEADGDYTRDIGYLHFAHYAANVSDCSSHDNLLNNVWYQPEEVFPVDGTPEERQHAFWVPVDSHYYEISQKLEGLELESCLNSTTCLSTEPKVAKTQRGTSAGIYLDNAAYRGFIYGKFNVTPVDMESAAVALICYQQRVPFIIIRALSDLAGGGSAESNEASTFLSLAASNSVTAVVEFIKLLSDNYIMDA
ncbi:Adenosylhomocysteine nucleosidase [Bertholletia excelsa]